MSCQINQSDVFAQEEADSWFERNFGQEVKKDREQDLALNYLSGLELEDKVVVEIGCADGWRLAELAATYRCECFGVEPSSKAVEAGRLRYKKSINLSVGSAAKTGLSTGKADVLVLGFCLYLCDRRELFKIAYECDRILKDDGILLIVDFLPPFAYKNPYHHREGLFSYKLDYSQMFLWNPGYTLRHLERAELPRDPNCTVNPDSAVGLTVLKKSERHAYPESPFG